MKNNADDIDVKNNQKYHIDNESPSWKAKSNKKYQRKNKYNQTYCDSESSKDQTKRPAHKINKSHFSNHTTILFSFAASPSLHQLIMYLQNKSGNIFCR